MASDYGCEIHAAISEDKTIARGKLMSGNATVKATVGGKSQVSYSISTKTLILTIAGALAFWITNFMISLTPIAAEYRAGLSISYIPMIVESLVGGLVIAFMVSYFLIRFYNRIPAANPIMKSVFLSLIALIAATAILELPASLGANGDVLHYFLIGLLFNVLRILALGIVIGLLMGLLHKGYTTTKSGSKSLRAS